MRDAPFVIFALAFSVLLVGAALLARRRRDPRWWGWLLSIPLILFVALADAAGRIKGT